MARPVVNLTVATDVLGWDDTVNDNFDAVAGPFPLARYADVGSLPAAADFEDCVALVETDNRIYHSDGVDWTPITITPEEAPPAATGWADSTAQSDFNTLLTALITSGVLEQIP